MKRSPSSEKSNEKKVKLHSSKKDVKPKFEKNTSSGKKSLPRSKKLIDTVIYPAKSHKTSSQKNGAYGKHIIKNEIKDEKGSYEKKKIKKENEEKNEDYGKQKIKKERKEEKGISGKQKIKNGIIENLKNKTVFKKEIALLNKKGKQVVQEFPLGKDGKPLWNKVKTEKKQLRENRKLHRTGEELYQLSVKAKAIWEKLRGKNHTDEEKEALVNEQFMLLKGQIPNVVHSHDMARVVQWMLKLGSASIRSSICEALCTNTVLYLKSQYASYCVMRALKYGSKTDRNSLMQSCNGQYLTLFNHTFASPAVELMYSVFAGAKQRKQIRKELYGEMHALISDDITSIGNIPEDLRPAILGATKLNLSKLLAKKRLLRYTLLQSLLHDFLSNCSDQDRSDIVELIQGDVLELLDTKEGSRVALQIVWHGTNKVKKVIVKALKGKVKEVASSETGHILLLALFDCVDDTVLLKKALIPELLTEAAELAKDEYGRKVILYLVAHRDPIYFHPQQIEILSQGDTIGVRKKDAAVREQEMLEAVSESLLQQIAADPATWLGGSSIAMVSLAIIKSGKGEPLKEVFEQLADYILDPSSVVEVNSRKFHVVEDSALHMVFKKLISQHSQQTESDKTQESFAKVLASRLTENDLNYLFQFNRGCFLIVLLFELKCKSIIKTLKSKITDSMMKFLQKQETTGAKILLKKLG